MDKKQKLRLMVLLFIIGLLLFSFSRQTTQSTKVKLFIVNRSSIPKVALQSIKVDGEKTDVQINELVPKRHFSTNWPLITIKKNSASVEFVFIPENKKEEKYVCNLKMKEGFSTGLIDIEYNNSGIDCGSFMTYDEFMDSGINSL